MVTLHRQRLGRPHQKLSAILHVSRGTVYVLHDHHTQGWERPTSASAFVMQAGWALHVPKLTAANAQQTAGDASRLTSVLVMRVGQARIATFKGRYSMACG